MSTKKAPTVGTIVLVPMPATMGSAYVDGCDVAAIVTRSHADDTVDLEILIPLRTTVVTRSHVPRTGWKLP